MIRYVIKFAFGDMGHLEFLGNSKSIAQALYGNLSYPVLSPDLVTINGLISDLENALTVWGTPPSNRGSSTQYQVVLTTREALEVAMISLGLDCMNQTPFMKDELMSGGWTLKRLSEPVGLVGPVADFHQVFNQLVPSGAVKLKWKLPVGAPRGSVSVYRVMQSLTADINSATQIGLTTKTSYTDLPAATRPSNFYWIIPVCTAGFGGTADLVQGFPQGPVIA